MFSVDLRTCLHFQGFSGLFLPNNLGKLNEPLPYLCWSGGEGHQGQVLALLGKVSVGHGEAEDLRQIGQLLLRRHSLTYRQDSGI